MPITRFAGIPVSGWPGPLPGGGYEGATKTLDRAVLRHARALQKWLDPSLRIEIRFNANCLSGGAWVWDQQSACSIGLNAGLRGRLDGPVFHEVYVVRALMVEAPPKGLVERHSNEDYVLYPVRGTADGIRLLKRIVDLNKLSQYLRSIQPAA